MRIALVSREYPPSQRVGGIATYVQETARKLAGLGHNVYVIAASDDIKKSTTEMDLGVTVFRLPGADFYIGERPTTLGLLRSKFRSILCFRSYRRNVASCLKSLAAKDLIDVIEFADFGNEGSEWIRRYNNLPWVVRLHGPTLLNRITGRKLCWLRRPIAYYRGIGEIKSIEKADTVTSPSDAMASVVRSWCIGSVTVSTIGNHIDISRWAGETPSTARDGSEEKPYLLFSAGTVCREKGYFELMKAVEKLHERGLNVRLKIAGRKGQLARKLEKRGSVSHRHGYVDLLGPIPRKQLRELYARSDLVIFPSWWEPFGLVCLEAMASGALVLGSLSGGMKEIVEDQQSGFLINPGDPNALAEKILNILSTDTLDRNRIRRAALRRSAAFASDQIVRRQIEIYQETIDRYGGQTS